MKIILLAIVLMVGLVSLFGQPNPQDLSESPKLVEQAIKLPDNRELTNEPPDVLSATNIEQWKSLIKNLKKDSFLPNFWRTESPQGCVILKSKGQSIVYKMQSVSVMVAKNASDILEADICTPKMDIVETRELGLKIFKMFGLDSTKFDVWCENVGTEWLDTPVFYGGDRNHILQIRHSFNEKQPWVMHFIISPEKANSEFMLEVEQQAHGSKHPSQSNTNELVAIALKTHTREAWLNVLYRDIEDDPNPDGGSGIIFPAIYFMVAGIVGVVVVCVIYGRRRK